MKKLLFLLIPAIGFTACKKEPIVVTSSLEDQLIGTWHLHETNTSIWSGQSNSFEQDYTIIFTSDGHYNLKQTGQPDEDYLWSISPDEQTFLSLQKSSTSTLYFTKAFDILSHSATYHHFNRYYTTTLITSVGDTVSNDVSVDWVLTK